MTQIESSKRNNYDDRDGEENAKPESKMVDKQGQRGQNARSPTVVIGGQLTGTRPLLIALSASDWDGCVQEVRNRRSMNGGG